MALSGPPLPDHGAFLPLVDDELALASRLPVLASDTLTFSAAAGADRLAAKGALHARLAAEAAATLDVYTTHLQADQRARRVSAAPRSPSSPPSSVAPQRRTAPCC